eukprot:15336456-Ditylum_brightwellii.AAC.2
MAWKVQTKQTGRRKTPGNNQLNKIQEMAAKNLFSILKEFGKLHYNLEIQKVNYDLQEAQLDEAQAEEGE